MLFSLPLLYSRARSMTHLLESAPGGAPGYYKFCECGRNITNMKPYKLKQHSESDLHERSMTWDEHTRNMSQHKAEAVKKRRETGACKDYDIARLENDRAQGYARQLKWKAQVVECECGCVVTNGKLAEHRKTQKHLIRVSVEEKPPNV